MKRSGEAERQAISHQLACCAVSGSFIMTSRCFKQDIVSGGAGALTFRFCDKASAASQN
jgi:hypothetical protein